FRRRGRNLTDCRREQPLVIEGVPLVSLPLCLNSAAQLEASLGTFYAPTRPLLDATVLEFRDPISRYARRFFHHLLRYQRFEKAFLLAVDIGARDLFMVSHFWRKRLLSGC
uniref:Uncharacterized protein n=1 Tax=Calidris pygmaea TaxID=425635 RepID=A0A8C3PPN0_9CHAR